MEKILTTFVAFFLRLKEDPRRWDQKLGLVPNTLSLIRLVYGVKLALRDLPEALDEDVETGIAGKLRPTDIVVLKLAAMFATDFVDGGSARLLKATTKAGAILDTLIDKIVVLLVLWVLWRRSLVPWSAVVMTIIFGREGLMMVAKPYIKKRYGFDMKVKQSGREKMFAQSIAIIMLVSTRTRGPAADFAAAVATTMTATSFKDYVEEYLLLVKQQQEK